MGKTAKIQPVKLFAGLIAASEEIINKTHLILTEKWGDIDTKSDIVQFSFTNYYEKEMGKNLLRQWISFKDLASPGILAEMKTETNNIENTFLLENSRQINIDPGYMALSKIVLASTKDFSHRIYLSNGIHAEITMLFKDKVFTVLPWTYPDYASDFAKKYLYKVREIYQNQLKNQQLF